MVLFINAMSRLNSYKQRRAKTGCVGLVLATGLGLAHAQSSPSVWQMSGGWQHYTEPQINLKGPELGVHWRNRNFAHYRFEADVHLGLQSYSSVQTGRLSPVLNVNTRWRVFKQSTTPSRWRYGLALHTHANFLRGTTSLGFGGYDRLSTQVWLPVRWQSNGDQAWTVDSGWLVWGEHVSRLSQVNASLRDVTNKQRKGAYLSVSKKINASRGEFEPYVRWTWVDDSNIKAVTLSGQARGAYEPQNTRLQVGVKWRFR